MCSECVNAAQARAGTSGSVRQSGRRPMTTRMAKTSSTSCAAIRVDIRVDIRADIRVDIRAKIQVDMQADIRYPSRYPSQTTPGFDSSREPPSGGWCVCVCVCVALDRGGRGMNRNAEPL